MGIQKKVLITGGKGDIAQSLKEQLQKKGYKVYTPSRDEMDITQMKDIDNVLKTNFDVIINNAGYIRPNTIEKINIAEVVDEMTVNFIAPVYICHKAIQKNPKVKIVNIGSTSGLKGRAGWLGYSASKSAIISLTESLQAEGYEAYIYNPRRTATKMRKELFPDEDINTLDTPQDVALNIIKVANL